MELGLGAGGTLGEATAFGFVVPDIRGRMGLLRDDLEVITRLFATGRATYSGDHASVNDAIDNPRGLQEPRIPIVVGGNGRTTWRLAAEFADELNLDGLSPVASAAAIGVLRGLCEERGRDPASLAVSVHVQPDAVAQAGAARAELLASYRVVGVSRVIALVRACVATDEALEAFAEDARAGGATLA